MFWSENPKILFDKMNYLKFFPNSSMDTIEKLNAIMRLSIYLGLALILTTNNYKYFYLPIMTGVFTFGVYKYKLDTVETFFNMYEQDNQEKKLDSVNCTVPTANNPFMNINLISDPKDKKKACSSSDKVKSEITNNFDINLYKNVSDVFENQNGQRTFYTMPSTTIPNEQTKFAKWLYGTGPTCKEKTMFCATPYSAN